MSGLRLSEDGRRVFAEWARSASPADRALVGQVLESVADGTWKSPRWFYTRDAQDRHMLLIQPREGLVVVVRFVFDNLPEEPDAFDLQGITETPARAAAD